MNKAHFAVLMAATVFLASVGFATPIAGNSVNVVSVIPGTTATKQGKAEDAAHASGDTGVMALGVQSTSLAALAGTTGDYAPFQVNALGAMYTQVVPNTTGGLSIFRSIDIDETEEGAKASAGMLYGCDVINDTASTKEYLKIYDGTVAGVVVGTDTPVITIPLPAAGVNQHISFGGSMGLAFATGITIAATTGIADNDTGAPAGNAVVVNCYYK